MKRNANAKSTRTAPSKKITYSSMRNVSEVDAFDGGYNITEVAASNGKPLKHVINNTMMRIDLPKALKPGDDVEFNIS